MQVAAVKALNGFDTAAYGNSTIEIPSALGGALGFSPLFGISADGINIRYPAGTATCFDGIISPPIVPGIVTNQTWNLSPRPTATLGGIPATVGFAGLIASFAQVYQFNVVIPASAPNGDLPFIVTLNGTQSFSGLIAVQAQ